jgi:hypothetical protein
MCYHSYRIKNSAFISLFLRSSPMNLKVFHCRTSEEDDFSILILFSYTGDAEVAAECTVNA